MSNSTSRSYKKWLALPFLVFGIGVASAESVEIDGLYYEMNTTDRTATVTYQTTSSDNYASIPANVVIPETINYNNIQYKVIEIGDKAFANCTVLESISIPASITKIGNVHAYSNYNSAMNYSGDEMPFYHCSSLKSVRIEDGSSSLTFGVAYSSYGGGEYSKGMFYFCPLEEIYVGRNIDYESYDFDNHPEYSGFSAFYNQPKLTKVTIGPLCTELTDYLFYNNSAITLMALPNVKKIGASTFEECSKLTTLNLGNSIESVGNRAFYNCSNITKLTLPSTTTSIGDYAFYNCNSITEVTVGNSLNSIGAYGFYGCESFTALVLPDSFTTMGESAFESCKKLTIAKLGTSLEAVPAKAFKDCTSLSEMIVPASAVSIGDQAFYNDSGLATITMNEGLQTIGNEVFWNNSGVMQFSIPGTVTEMGTNCFYGCTRTSYLTFRDGTEILTIDNRGCRSSKVDAIPLSKDYSYRYFDYFYDCPIRFLTLGRNLKYSYSDSEGLYDILDNGLTYVKRASAPFVNSQDLRSVKIGKYVTFLWHHLLDGCSNVDKIEFPDGLSHVYSYALGNCPKLTTLDFPNPLVLLDKGACINNIGLAKIIFNEEKGNDLSFIIGDSTLRNCPSLTNLTFPAKTTSIGNYCFYDTPNLTDINFVDSPREVFLGYGANAQKTSTPQLKDSEIPLFGNSQLQSLYMGRNINYYASSFNGYSPFYNQNFLTDVKFSQAGTVTYCKDYLLMKANVCESLVLPESLTSIGNYTFSDMTVLKGITIPNKVTEIGRYAFTKDKTLKYANLSTSCAWLKEGLFEDCDSLASITIPPVVTKMDTYMFSNCVQLANVTFEDNTDVLVMGYGASDSEYGLFRDCPVETLYLGRWLSYNTDEPSRAPFYSIEALKNLTFGEPVGVVDKYMFSYCTGLEELYLPDNIESVGLWGFRGCSSLKKVRFSEKLSQISDYGFSECTSLDNVVFPESMSSVADNSFSECTSLRSLDLGKSLMIIGPAAFKNDVALEGIEIPETLYGLGVEAFANCTSLPYVAIKAISSVGRQAFEGCTGLQWVSLSDKTTSLGENSFSGCTGIRYVKSYATYAPEGLVNFPQEVEANGTLFVPASAMENYQYSPTWENWVNIRPISDDVFVSSISLNTTEHSFKPAETLQLVATVGAEDASDKNVIWRTSDAEIATVDENGLVTAVSVGDAVISAIAADGSGVKADCAIKVLPTLVEAITINAANTSVKKGRSIALEATIEPANATNNNLVWSSSNPAVATVSEDGVLTAVATGDVVITATAADDSGISTSIDLAIIAPTKGDSNDNDEVTITDAVNTANYAVGNEVENFCFEAADVNGDNRITLADASGTIVEVLNQPVAVASMMARKVSGGAQIADMDCLVVDGYNTETAGMTVFDVKLDNTFDYVALQADIKLPEGMSLQNVEVGPRAEAYHTLMQRVISDNVVRVALFNLDNEPFADNDEAILKVMAKSNGSVIGDVALSNILASDSEANEYVLASRVVSNNGTTGIDAVYGDGTFSVVATEYGLTIFNAEGQHVDIYTVDGAKIAGFKAESNAETRNVGNGVYVVTAGEMVVKVIVK